MNPTSNHMPTASAARFGSLRRTTCVASLALALALALMGGWIGCSEDEEAACSEFDLPQVAASAQPICISDDPTPVDTVATRDILIQNLGNADLEITSSSLEGNDRGYFSVEGLQPTTLMCPETVAARIVYAPTQPGWDTATLVVRSNAENFPTLEIFVLGLATPVDDPDFSPTRPTGAVGACPNS